MSDSLASPPDAFEGFCPIAPIPKGRPRFARRGKFVQTYTPKDTEQYENDVRKWMIAKYGLTTSPMDGALKATYEFILPKPKSARKMDFFSFRKPDIDNLVKAFQDALDFKRKINGVALGVMANDSRVSVVNASKRYAAPGEQPGTRFRIERARKVAVIVDGDVSSLAGVFSPETVLVPFDELKTCEKDSAVTEVIVFCRDREKGEKIGKFCGIKFENSHKCSII